MLLKGLILAGLLAVASPLMWACSGDDRDDTASGDDDADPTDDFATVFVHIDDDFESPAVDRLVRLEITPL